MSKKSLTAVILTKNEEEMIADCLSSLSFVDKIIVVDNNSTDTTIEIVKKNGAQIIISDVDDFAARRTLPLKKITTDYVLYVDADERVSPQLAQEIQHIIDGDASIAAYKVPRQNFYFGNYPWPKIELLERLFLTKSLKGWHGKVHETPLVSGEVRELKNSLLHYTHRDFSSMVDKTNNWSEIEAKLRVEAGHPQMKWWRFPRVMVSAFIDSYIRQRGFKAGTAGLLESIYQSFSIFITYAKLWELQEEQKRK